jgi:hypothetical protein
MKAQAIMASRTSKVETVAIPLAEFAADIERRRLVAGVTELPRNAGANRTESKQALLKAIDEAAAKKGFTW